MYAVVIVVSRRGRQPSGVAPLGHGARRVAEVSNDGTEETAVELVSEARLPELLRSGGVDHALVLAAFLFRKLHQEAPVG